VTPPPKPLKNESLYVVTMVDYESLKNMFCFLKVKNMPMKHWFDNLGWDIVCNPPKKKLIKESPFLVLFINEVTSFDNKLGLDFHPWVRS
jgi:hypothetical protein